MKPVTRYAKSDGLNIAYQVVGSGDLDLVFVMGWVSHIEYFWKEPHFARFLNRMASFSRLILLDKRGTGMSDRPGGLATLEERMDDVRAVMDAAGSERAALFGVAEGGPMCALFAATYPERTRALVIHSGYARALWAPDYPWAMTEEEWQRRLTYLEDNWGSDVLLNLRAPSLAHSQEFRDWWSTYLRMSSSPGAQRALSWMNWQIDIRHVLPTIGVPTLVLHREGDRTIAVGNGRYLAEHIPGARYVEFPGNDHLPFAGDQDRILDEVEQFLTGTTAPTSSERVLATILFTEIVGALALAAQMGDQQWTQTVVAHDEMFRTTLNQNRGREVVRATAGFQATFDGPARAIRCAMEFVDKAREIGLEVRAGLHTGECDLNGRDESSLAIQIASRVMSRAPAGEVVVSNTVSDLVAGSGITFEALEHRLVIASGRVMQLFRVIDADGNPARARMEPVSVPTDAPSLSRREREVAILIGRGLSNRLIAEQLSISIATVERHAANIFNKLGLHSRAQVAVWVANEGLLGRRGDVASPRDKEAVDAP